MALYLINKLSHVVFHKDPSYLLAIHIATDTSMYLRLCPNEAIVAEVRIYTVH